MPHAPRPAGPVVLAVAPRGPHQAVAREDQQGLEPRVAAPGRPDRPHRRSGAPHPRGYAAVRGQVVVVREPPDVDRHRELRRGPRADAGHGEQARVGLVALEQRRRLGLEGPGLVEGLRYPGGQEPDLPVLGLDERRRGRGGGGRGLLLASIYFSPFSPTYFRQSRQRGCAGFAYADAPLSASRLPPPSRPHRRWIRPSGGTTVPLS